MERTKLLTMILLSPFGGRAAAALGPVGVAFAGLPAGFPAGFFAIPPAGAAAAGFRRWLRRAPGPRRPPAISSRLWSSLEDIVKFVSVVRRPIDIISQAYSDAMSKGEMDDARRLEGEVVVSLRGCDRAARLVTKRSQWVCF